ncbi:hypothetical protein O181_029441 [Austropuccinia psidii MF-1]|uniref:Uncharacterized protein n=1 Tax=Austropuccinia psidii MF-1 TaxID=1389203 RepID=A0A9Q3CWG7_9BASI|nr:hypothetical protein [Austropuccinia psidii MF-1]
MEPYLKEGDQILVSTLNFDNIKGPNEMRDSFVGPLTIIELIGTNAVEVRLAEEFSRKHPVFPVCLVKPHFQTEEVEIPLQEEEPYPTRNSGSGGLPWTCEENYQGQEDQT